MKTRAPKRKGPARSSLEDIAWTKTPSDYRSTFGGKRSVLVLGERGTTIKTLSEMSEAELLKYIGKPQSHATVKYSHHAKTAMTAGQFNSEGRGLPRCLSSLSTGAPRVQGAAMTFKKRVKLIVRSRDNADRLAELVSEGGTVQVRHVSEPLGHALRRWIQHGFRLSEGNDRERSLRHIAPDDPRLLELLHEHLTRTSGFITRLEIRFAAPIGVMLQAERPRRRVAKEHWASQEFEQLDQGLTRWTIRRLEKAQRTGLAAR